MSKYLPPRLTLNFLRTRQDVRQRTRPRSKLATNGDCFCLPSGRGSTYKMTYNDILDSQTVLIAMSLFRTCAERPGPWCLILISQATEQLNNKNSQICILLSKHEHNEKILSDVLVAFSTSEVETSETRKNGLSCWWSSRCPGWKR